MGFVIGGQKTAEVEKRVTDYGAETVIAATETPIADVAVEVPQSVDEKPKTAKKRGRKAKSEQP